MVVPGSWTLDDLREPDLHLFRPPEATETRRRSRRSANMAPVDATDVEQLALGVEETAAPDTTAGLAVGAAEPIVDAPSSVDPADSWSPSFDDGDDLDGLLAAESPLLARAFRGDNRPRS
tara:strand:+ start:2222 stop:2581 length:360 start_codon:yes stop_codon:yes gene_type:complete